MADKDPYAEVVLVARTVQEGVEWLASHQIDPVGVHIIVNADGFRSLVREKGLYWRLAHDDEGQYFKVLPSSLQREMDRWLFHHPPK